MTAPTGAMPVGPLRIDRGAIVAGYVGLGMAATIAVSFLLVIPIEPIYWLLAPMAGLLIGYYANQRSWVPRRAWRRTLRNAAYAGVVTGLTLSLLLLGVKALFFYADNGFRDGSLGKPLACSSGADCVYARYLADRRGPQLVAAGITDAASFGAFYWRQQFTTAGLLLGLTVAGGVLGGVVYGFTRPRES